MKSDSDKTFDLIICFTGFPVERFTSARRDGRPKKRKTVYSMLTEAQQWKTNHFIRLRVSSSHLYKRTHTHFVVGSLSFGWWCGTAVTDVLCRDRRSRSRRIVPGIVFKTVCPEPNVSFRFLNGDLWLDFFFVRPAETDNGNGRVFIATAHRPHSTAVYKLRFYRTGRLTAGPENVRQDRLLSASPRPKRRRSADIRRVFKIKFPYKKIKNNVRLPRWFITEIADCRFLGFFSSRDRYVIVCRNAHLIKIFRTTAVRVHDQHACHIESTPVDIYRARIHSVWK